MIIDIERDKEYRTQAYTYSMSAAPLSPGSTEGSVPNMSADLGPEQDPIAFMQLYRKPILLEEFNVSGRFHATEPTDTDGLTAIAGLSDLENLNTDLIWPANQRDFFGSVGHLIHAVDGIEPIAVDSFSWEMMEFFNEGWVMPNMVGNGWVLFKQFMSAFDLTLFEYGWWTPINAIKLNPIFEEYDLDGANIISSSITLGTTDPADKVTVNRYEYSNHLNQLTEITPRFEVGDASIISVDAGETVTAQIQTTFSMTSIETQHPRCIDEVWDTVEYFSSIYSVVANDDVPIKAQEWRDFGGELWIEINKEDPTIIDVHVTGANLDHKAPFRVSMSSGKGKDYSSLHVYGRGVSIRQYPTTVYTGASRPVQSDEEIEVDNPFLCRHENMPNALIRVAREAAGFAWTMTFSVPPHQGTMRVNDRIKHKGHWWRIDSVSISQDEVSYTCTEATQIAHVNEMFEGVPIAELNEKYKGLDMVELAAVMLRD